MVKPGSYTVLEANGSMLEVEMDAVQDGSSGCRSRRECLHVGLMMRGSVVDRHVARADGRECRLELRKANAIILLWCGLPASVCASKNISP